MAETDKYGRHEILDRASIIQGMVERELCDHGGLKPEEKKLADQAATALAKLYLLVGDNNHTE